MSLERLDLAILVYRPDRMRVDEGVLARLGETSSARTSFGTAQSTVSITLASVDSSGFSFDRAGAVAFRQARDQAFITAAEWLEARSNEVFDTLRAQGYESEFWLFPQISDDQMEFTASPRFLLACASRGLPLKLITND